MSNTHYKLIFLTFKCQKTTEKIYTRFCSFFVLVPVESFFVKLDDNLECIIVRSYVDLNDV